MAVLLCGPLGWQACSVQQKGEPQAAAQPAAPPAASFDMAEVGNQAEYAAEPPGEPTVKLTAAPDGAGPYMVGESIFVTLTFTGARAEAVKLDLGLLGRASLVVTCQGRTGRSQHLDTGGGLSSVYEADLQPGQTYTHRILLNEWIAFRQPDTYSVRLTYDGARSYVKEAAGIRAACELPLTIVAKDAAHLSQALGELHQRRAAQGPGDERALATLALCYSGEDEALPYLRALAEQGTGDSRLQIEVFRGIRRVGTLGALDLLADLWQGPNEAVAHNAMVEIGLIAQQATDPAVRARAEELKQAAPADFRFVETTIMD